MLDPARFKVAPLSFNGIPDAWGVCTRDEQSDLQIEAAYSSEASAQFECVHRRQTIRSQGWHVDPPSVQPLVLKAE